MSVVYALPQSLPTTDIERDNLRRAVAGVAIHLDHLCQLDIATVVRTFLKAHPEIEKIQLELTEDQHGGCLWKERVVLAHGPSVVEAARISDAMDLPGELYRLHNQLQAKLNIDSVDSLQARYGKAVQKPSGTFPADLWIDSDLAKEHVSESQYALKTLQAPEIEAENEPVPPTGRRQRILRR